MKAKRGPADRDVRIPVVYPRPLTPQHLRVLTRQNALDRRFRGIDRFLERWSVGQGSGQPISDEAADKLPTSHPTPLSLDDSITADLAILHSPDWARRFVFAWYRSDKSPEQIGEQMDLDRREVYREFKIVLAYMLGRFTEMGFKIPLWEPDT